MDEFIVKASALSKSYGTILALDGVDLSLPRGKIIGFLGPNGSGKTTFVKILAGLLTKTAGEVIIDDKEIGVETKAIVSYLPERTYLNPSQRVSDCVDFFSDFYADFDAERAISMLKDLGVDLDAKLKTLSKGTKEKVQLVLVMARRAQLYLLDEPIAGVDPAAREYILDTIIKNHAQGATILISTHLIADIQGVLDEYVLIYNGHIVEKGDARAIESEKGMSLDAYFREVFRYV
ncbi:MAG: ABC transporter ATP-binding protein [Clostridia bacterium]|nr:ABC transporter ATP-binding protein [Clostridia bacterium]